MGLGTQDDIVGQRGKHSNVIANAGGTQGSWVQTSRTHWMKRTLSHRSATAGSLVLLNNETLAPTHKEHLEEGSAKPCFLSEAEKAELPSLASGSMRQTTIGGPMLMPHALSSLPFRTQQALYMSTSCYKYFENILET